MMCYALQHYMHGLLHEPVFLGVVQVNQAACESSFCSRRLPLVAIHSS